VLREDSCMEALLRVTADSTIGAWESATVDLISLYVDGKVRFVKQCADGPEEITLVYRNNTPAKVLLDGSDPDMKAEFDMFKLHFALGESVLDESKHVTIADLQSLLKKGDKQISKKEALKILAQLRIRYLHGALVVAADRASIQCKVKRLDL
jgi:hypothetical protein